CLLTPCVCRSITTEHLGSDVTPPSNSYSTENELKTLGRLLRTSSLQEPADMPVFTERARRSCLGCTAARRPQLPSCGFTPASMRPPCATSPHGAASKSRRRRPCRPLAVPQILVGCARSPCRGGPCGRPRRFTKARPPLALPLI